MTDLILVYITCGSFEEAKKIGNHLMDKKLCACTNIFPEMRPMFYWPPKSGKLNEGTEAVLIAKTIESKYSALEKEVQEIHSYEVPCIIAIPTAHVNKSYYDWLLSELKTDI